jgi:hypothetical protein
MSVSPPCDPALVIAVKERCASVYVLITYSAVQVGIILMTESKIHEHTILLRFPGIILRVLRLEVSLYNIANQSPCL